jgi:hypothetical protein
MEFNLAFIRLIVVWFQVVYMATWEKISYNCYDNIICYIWDSFNVLTILKNMWKFEALALKHVGAINKEQYNKRPIKCAFVCLFVIYTLKDARYKG